MKRFAYADQRPAVGPCSNIVEEIAVPETSSVAHSLGMKLVDRGADFGNFVCVEKAPDYCVAVPHIVREIILSGGRLGHPHRL